MRKAKSEAKTSMRTPVARLRRHATPPSELALLAQVADDLRNAGVVEAS